MALQPNQSQVAPVGLAHRPGYLEPTGGRGERPVFGGVRRQLVEHKRQSHGKLFVDAEWGAVQHDPPSGTPKGRQFSFEQVSEIRLNARAQHEIVVGARDRVEATQQSRLEILERRRAPRAQAYDRIHHRHGVSQAVRDLFAHEIALGLGSLTRAYIANDGGRNATISDSLPRERRLDSEGGAVLAYAQDFPAFAHRTSRRRRRRDEACHLGVMRRLELTWDKNVDRLPEQLASPITENLFGRPIEQDDLAGVVHTDDAVAHRRQDGFKIEAEGLGEHRRSFSTPTDDTVVQRFGARVLPNDHNLSEADSFPTRWSRGGCQWFRLAEMHDTTFNQNDADLENQR